MLRRTLGRDDGHARAGRARRRRAAVAPPAARRRAVRSSRPRCGARSPAEARAGRRRGRAVQHRAAARRDRVARVEADRRARAHRASRPTTRRSTRPARAARLTALPFVARAVIDALREFPHLNATVDGDALVVHRAVNLGIAVDLDYQGLVVPVIRHADDLRLPALAGASATSRPAPGPSSSAPTTWPAARSRSPTRARPARGCRSRSSTRRRSASSRPTASPSRSSSTTRRAAHRADGQSLPDVRPPRGRRRVRGRVPPAGARDRRAPRLGRRGLVDASAPRSGGAPGTSASRSPNSRFHARSIQSSKQRDVPPLRPEDAERVRRIGSEPGPRARRSTPPPA